MDILEKNKYLNDITGIVISKIDYMDKGSYYKVLTEKNGYIDLFLNGNNSLIPFSKYSFKLSEKDYGYNYLESYILKYNRLIDKKEIVFLNYITEVFSKVLLDGIETDEIYNLLDFIILNLNSKNVFNLMLYFLVLFLKYNGYYMELDFSFSKTDKYCFDILNFSIGKSVEKNNFTYMLNSNEYKIIENIYNNKFNINFLENEVYLKRLIGIFTNTLCIHFNIKELNSFKFII